MYELFELFQKLAHEPLTTGTVVACLIFIIDRIFKRFFIQQIRKLLHIKNVEDVKEYMDRLNTIESKLDVLLKERGIEEWSQSHVRSSMNASIRSQQKRKAYSWLSATTKYAVNSATNITKYTGGSKMKVNKIILVPLLSAIIEFTKQSTGYEVPFGQNVDLAADVVLWGIATLGIWIHPRKEALSEAEKGYINA